MLIEARQQGLFRGSTLDESVLRSSEARVDRLEVLVVWPVRRGADARLMEQAGIDVCDFVHTLSSGSAEVRIVNRVPVLD